MEKNTILELTIEDISTEGEGIGRAGGVVAFVPGTYPGDRVLAEVKDDKGRFYKCVLKEILEPSADRVAPACGRTAECGGCPLMGLSYDAQLAWKQRSVFQALTRLGGLEAPAVRPILSSGKTLRYRNKGEFVLQGNKAGCRARGSHRFVEIDDCPIQQEAVIEAMHRELAQTKPTQKYFTRLISRCADTGETMIIKQHDDGEGTASCRILHDHIVTDSCTLKTEVSPLSFYQVNPEGCSILYSKVREYAALTGTEKVLDLYCGAGSIGLTLAGDCERVIGVEVVRQAFVDANRNAAINGIANATFVCGKAEDVIDTRLQGVKADVVIVDPPRAGCAKSLLEAIGRIAPEKLIYVSCNPSTLARDVKILTELGFTFKEATPVDMFPHSVHCETVCLLVLRNPVTHINIDVDVDVEELVQDKRGQATYEQIRDYVKEQTGLYVTNLNIAQTKRKCGIIERENYNLPKSEDSRQPNCTKEKEDAIKEAFKHFGMI